MKNALMTDRAWGAAAARVALLGLVAAGAGTAQAQTSGSIPTSSVNLYGVLDAAYVYQSGSVNKADGTSSGPVVKNSLNGGVARGSRIGFRGVEDLGGGTKAVFTAEMGFYLDTGVSSQGAQALNQYPSGLAFGRQAFVGLTGNYGSVTMGRQYTPAFLVTTLADPFFQGTAGTMANLQNTSSRANNSVIYVTPNYKGLTASAMYSFGEVPGDTAAGRQYSGNVLYQPNGLALGVGYYNVNNAAGTATSRTTTFVGSYDFDVVKVFADYQIQRSSMDNAPGSAVLGADRIFTSYDSVLIGVSVPFGPHQFLASYIHNFDKRRVANANRDADQFAVGYKYNMSKRTYVYAAYGVINNRNGASYTIGDALYVNGNARMAFNLGFSHDF